MKECIFCKIIEKELPAKLEGEKQNFIIVKDINPKAPVHFLLISRKHIESLTTLAEADKKLIGEMLYETKLLAAKQGLTDKGYKVVINCGKEGGQFVPHLHFHFLGGKDLSEFL